MLDHSKTYICEDGGKTNGGEQREIHVCKKKRKGK